MIRGVVLCGGESKRMGSDKGLLSGGDHNWAQHAFSKLEALNVPVHISINKTQVRAYHCFFGAHLLIIDRVVAKGPLAGLLSVHLSYPDDDLLVLACDMIEMDTEALTLLKHHTVEFPGFDYYLYALEEFLEPLCAVYTSASLKKILRDLNEGNLPGFSLHKIIKQGNYKTLPIIKIEKFNNYNTATI